MSRFKEIHEQKFRLLDLLLSDQQLIKAIVYDTDDFLEKPDVDYDRAKKELMKTIFPQRFVPGTPEEKRTYLTISFEDYRLVNRSYKIGYIRVTTFTHADLFVNKDGLLRVDLILERVDDLLNDQRLRGVGIGRLQFAERNPIIVNPQYHGEFLLYQITEFN